MCSTSWILLMCLCVFEFFNVSAFHWHVSPFCVADRLSWTQKISEIQKKEMIQECLLLTIQKFFTLHKWGKHFYICQVIFFFAHMTALIWINCSFVLWRNLTCVFLFPKLIKTFVLFSFDGKSCSCLVVWESSKRLYVTNNWDYMACSLDLHKGF